MRFYRALIAASLLHLQIFAQGTLRLDPFGGRRVEIPVAPLLATGPVDARVYFVSGGGVYLPLTPDTIMRPNSLGVSRVEPITVNLAGIPVGSPATFQIRVKDPSVSWDETGAGGFLVGRSPEVTLDFAMATSFILTPELRVVPEPKVGLLLLLGSLLFRGCTGSVGRRRLN